MNHLNNFKYFSDYPYNNFVRCLVQMYLYTDCFTTKINEMLFLACLFLQLHTRSVWLGQSNVPVPHAEMHIRLILDILERDINLLMDFDLTTFLIIDFSLNLIKF